MLPRCGACPRNHVSLRYSLFRLGILAARLSSVCCAFYTPSCPPSASCRVLLPSPSRRVCPLPPRRNFSNHSRKKTHPLVRAPLRRIRPRAADIRLPGLTPFQCFQSEKDPQRQNACPARPQGFVRGRGARAVSGVASP